MLEPPPHPEDDYGELRRELVRAVGRVCPRWLADRAEDLVQVGMMRVMEIQRQREGTAVLSPFYLRKVAYSALVDEIRRSRRRQEVSMMTDSGAMDPTGPEAAGASDPERRSAGREIGQAIRDCLGRLVTPRRRAVVLHLQGHSVPEVGQLLALRTKQADNLVYRGLADLRQCLESRGITP